MGSSGKGWIKLHRSLLSWQWYGNPVTKDVFLHLLLSANWENEPVKIGRYETGKGQAIVTYPALARALGVTAKQIRAAFGHLLGTGEVTVERAGNALLVTVLNFERYQEGTVKGTARAGKGRAQGTPVGTAAENLPIIDKEVKKEKDEKNALRAPVPSERETPPPGWEDFDEWAR